LYAFFKIILTGVFFSFCRTVFFFHQQNRVLVLKTS
jgi:hypothetical protein